ncbi:MAG: ABC transporter permease [Dehalococcoidia bacterium]|nr:ABC transporter permease [Dehalococcoidia bacterium]RLC63101.1 MAG: ABC transporter permease [Chloroflexota bacterium]
MSLRGFVSFAIGKISGAIITIFAIICFNFVLFRMIPGDPVRLMFRDPRVPLEAWELARERFGLTGTLWEQFIAYLNRLFLHGDLGTSFWRGKPVLEVVAARIPNTLWLIILSIILAIIIGTILGAICGWRAGTKLDTSIVAIALSMWSLPGFCIGLIFLLIFAIRLGIFPLGGLYTPASGLSGLAYLRDVLWHAFLPVCTLIIWYMGEYLILMRGAMVDVVGQDYITTARAKGLKESTILKNHALRNAILPVVTLAGISLAYAVAGVVQIETVFGWPGVGRLMYEAVMNRDYPLVQGVFLVLAVAVVMANLIVDLIYGYIDPRIKIGRSA